MKLKIRQNLLHSQSSSHSPGKSMASKESQRDIFSDRGTIMKKHNEAKKFI